MRLAEKCSCGASIELSYAEAASLGAQQVQVSAAREALSEWRAGHDECTEAFRASRRSGDAAR